MGSKVSKAFCKRFEHRIDKGLWNASHLLEAGADLARHQVVLYVCKCIDYRVAGDLRNKVLPMNDFEPKMESLTTTNVRKTIFNQLISLCEHVP